MGGAHSECREGHDGPLCDNCIDGYYQDDDDLCHACEEVRVKVRVRVRVRVRVTEP